MIDWTYPLMGRLTIRFRPVYRLSERLPVAGIFEVVIELDNGTHGVTMTIPLNESDIWHYREKIGGLEYLFKLNLLEMNPDEIPLSKYDYERSKLLMDKYFMETDSKLTKAILNQMITIYGGD